METKQRSGLALFSNLSLNSVAVRLSSILVVWALPSRSLKRRLWPLGLATAYVVVIHQLGGLRADHVFIASLALLDSYNEKLRSFLKYFLPFILTGMIYDSMRYFYWDGISGHVHVAEPYYRDRQWFGIPTLVHGYSKLLTPNEFFTLHTYKVLDLLCGFAYLVYVGEYLVPAFYLFLTHRLKLLAHFGLCFLCVNLMGFITYFIYPAAPPWYVSQYGLGPVRLDVQPNAAAAQRFDQILGTHLFDQIYGRGVDVFGAYPSLHVSYPLLAALVTFQIPELRLWRVPAVLFYLLMCFSAVYLQHHYVVDILLGTLFALITWVALVQVTNKARSSAAVEFSVKPTLKTTEE